MYPHFLGIGAQKAGTSWLHHNLGQHPQIWMPPLKEIHYFDHQPPSLRVRAFSNKNHHRAARQYFFSQLRSWLRQPGDASQLCWAARYWLGRRNDDWYQSLFAGHPGLITGEICPGYCRLNEAEVAAVHARMPNARIIYFLRDPIDRAWSTTVMHFNKRGFPGIDNTSDAEILAFLADARTLKHADYLSNLRAWEAHYPSAQIFIGFFDELTADPAGLLRRVLSFLGVDDLASTLSKQTVARRINEGRGEPLPERFRPFLVRMLRPQLEGLHQRFESPYTRAWLERADVFGQPFATEPHD